MAKKKKVEKEMTDGLLNTLQRRKSDSNGPDMNNLEKIANMAKGSLSDEEKGEFLLMFTLASNGVTPEEYTQFYNIFHAAGMIADGQADDFDDEEAFFPFPGNIYGRNSCDVKEYKPLKDAADRTLVLKVQMKNVTKPPMWREVEIPADYNFMQLHEVIQEITGLEDCHLWQFNVKAYDDSLRIGFEMDEDEFQPALDYITHDAEETLVTQFLQTKGDKLEYVYDFGDDWIFIVEVKDLAARKIEHPVCKKFKSELNAIEDFGGIYAYQEARYVMEEWGTLTKKEKKECMEERGFETEDEYLEFLNSCRINLDDVNDALRVI